MTKILRENPEAHAYCDTDSVVTTKKLPDSYTDDKEYGKWKLERMIKKAVFVADHYASTVVFVEKLPIQN